MHSRWIGVREAGPPIRDQIARRRFRGPSTMGNRSQTDELRDGSSGGCWTGERPRSKVEPFRKGRD
jgi:hypothetical protein